HGSERLHAVRVARRQGLDRQVDGSVRPREIAAKVNGSSTMTTEQDRPAEATQIARKATRPAARGVSYTLVVTDGPDKGKSFRIEPSLPSRVLVGQSPSCDLRVTDKLVS